MLVNALLIGMLIQFVELEFDKVDGLIVVLSA